MDFHTDLIARKLFGGKNSTGIVSKLTNSTCPTIDESGPTIVPIAGSMTFHTVACIISGVCCALSLIVVLLLVFQHATNYTAPVQQRQIIRIVFLVPWVALFSFLTILAEKDGDALAPSVDFGCSLALSAFLLFVCDLILSNVDGFDELFGKGALARGQLSGGSPGMLKRVWYCVLQYIPVSTILWIAAGASVAAGTYCSQSDSIHFAHIWITIFKNISTGVAIVAVLRFYKKNKKFLQPHGVMLKLVAFKGIIGLQFLQGIIFTILVSKKVLKPTKYLTYDDATVGIPSLVLACEMPLFSLLVFFAYSANPYKAKKGAVKAGSPIKAIIDAINYTDILSCFVRGPMRLVREQNVQMLRSDSVPLQAKVYDSEHVETGYVGQQGSYSDQGSYAQQGGYAPQHAPPPA